MGEILLAAVIVLADQLSKVGAVDLAARRGSTVLIPGVIGLTCTYNYGASWGILSGKTVFLTSHIIQDIPEKHNMVTHNCSVNSIQCNFFIGICSVFFCLQAVIKYFYLHSF